MEVPQSSGYEREEIVKSRCSVAVRMLETGVAFHPSDGVFHVNSEGGNQVVVIFVGHGQGVPPRSFPGHERVRMLMVDALETGIHPGSD